ncbi:MAG TPA: DegT/DnrJ/EryC1/StrS family aminotransferase [Chloroflexia bacterium]|jgi:dTDP-4-amino-4,6-dideoxygalactose transaminase|nr:DegT/DnrJ/EryC1/StrS family aminotransferase [Chloroflexia bacterium]
MIPMAKPLIGEEEKQEVLRVLGSGGLAQGSEVKAFEDGFAAALGVKHAVATANGTTALHLALLANGVGPGDEVITVPFTFIASANAVLYCGATPVFVDIEPDSFNMNPDLIEAAITPRTKAILPVHLYGNPADMPRIMAIAERHGLRVIEDACQAHGATIAGRTVGTFGTGCFSFYPTKNITTAEGGIITTNDDEVADLARMLRAHGMRRRYYHEMLGYNFRMTDVHAAIGVAQLPKLEEFTRRRQANAAYLSAHLPADKVGVPVVRPDVEHVFHQYTVRVLPPLERDAVRAKLAEAGVGSEVYYPLPVHRQQVYRDRGYGDLCFPVTEETTAQVLSLPVHPALTEQDLAAVVAAVRAL